MPRSGVTNLSDALCLFNDIVHMRPLLYIHWFNKLFGEIIAKIKYHSTSKNKDHSSLLEDLTEKMWDLMKQGFLFLFFSISELSRKRSGYQGFFFSIQSFFTLLLLLCWKICLKHWKRRGVKNMGAFLVYPINYSFDLTF